jgi:hypothetical protein
MATKNILTPEEEKLSYAKYFYREMAKIPQDKIDIWQGPASDPAGALPIEDRNLFLDEVTPGMEIGFCVASNGTGFVANATFMPGVTVDMFDWWFGWHSIGPDLRYKLWDREDHFYARADNPDYVRNPDVPNSQKTWGMNHSILEDIGLGGPENLLLSFKKPSDLGYSMNKIGLPGCASMVCAVGHGGAPAVMTHKCVEAGRDIWFKSRFWMGYGIDERGQAIKLIPDGESIPDMLPRALFGHNIKEYANLAAILPELYAEEKDNW